MLLGPLLATLAGCSPEDRPAPVFPADPVRGRLALFNDGYVRCGIPWSVYEPYAERVRNDELLPDREGRNAELPYYYTSYTTETGVELLTTNCLVCHADAHPETGEVVVGLGDAGADFTQDVSEYAALVPLMEMTDAERDEAEKWSERIVATAPHIVTDTTGANPADALAQALYAHRDPTTLAWSDTPRMELPAGPIPTDVPPWWGLHKKEAMLYTGAGQGNFARIMMTASMLCTDTVEEADEIYAAFPDIEAYLRSLRPPPFPGEIDAARAAAGEAVFLEHCARCHGTYGEDWTYPSLVVPVAEVGTDATLTEAFSTDFSRFRDWFDASWYGQDATLVPTGGYVAPPLDGIWATGPYLHNGAVPSLQTLLDSGTRPTYWRRTGRVVLEPEIGMGYTAVDVDKEASGGSILLVDTTLPGWGNGGHTFGDVLTAEARADLVEYLKTL